MAFINGNEVLFSTHLHGGGKTMSKVWETELTTAEMNVIPDNNNALNLERGALLIIYPELTEALSSRPNVYIAKQTGDARADSQIVTNFDTTNKTTVGAAPVYYVEWEKVTEDTLRIKSGVLGVNSTGLNSAENVQGLRLIKADGEERYAVNTIYMYFKTFPVGTKFELWGY